MAELGEKVALTFVPSLAPAFPVIYEAIRCEWWFQAVDTIEGEWSGYGPSMGSAVKCHSFRGSSDVKREVWEAKA